MGAVFVRDVMSFCCGMRRFRWRGREHYVIFQTVEVFHRFRTVEFRTCWAGTLPSRHTPHVKQRKLSKYKKGGFSSVCEK